jgi:hypothetical protein
MLEEWERWLWKSCNGKTGDSLRQVSEYTSVKTAWITIGRHMSYNVLHKELEDMYQNSEHEERKYTFSSGVDSGNR